jgi:hypothetical protein
MSKLSPDIIHHWELTLPNKEISPYTQLLNFLEKRANCTIATSTATPTRQAPEQYNHHRQSVSRWHAFTATHSPSTCPICRGQHGIWVCDIFKAKSKNVLRKQPCASIARERRTQFFILPPNPVVCAENVTTRCCIGTKLKSRPDLSQTAELPVDRQHLLRHLIRHSLRHPLRHPLRQLLRHFHVFGNLKAHHPSLDDRGEMTMTSDDSKEDRITNNIFIQFITQGPIGYSSDQYSK